MKSINIRAGIQNGVTAFRAYLFIRAGKKVLEYSYFKLKRPGHRYFPIISPVELHHLRPVYGLRWLNPPGAVPFYRKKRAAKIAAADGGMRGYFLGEGRVELLPEWTADEAPEIQTSPWTARENREKNSLGK